MTEGRLRTVTLLNGRRVPANRARISVFDNALLYAEGLFETFLAVDDRVIFMPEHLDRLYKGAGVIDLTPPVDRETLSGWMVRCVKAHPDRVKKLRLTITSGESVKWTGVQGTPQVILTAASHQLPTKAFRLLVSDLRVDQTSVFRRIKTISYAIHASALKRARQARFDDALLLNGNDEVAEVTSANIFWVKDSHIYTPPLSAGCLEGVTRKVAFAVSRDLGYEVEERREHLPGLLEADEVFISSSLKLVIGVSQIMHGSRRYDLKAGPITRAFRKHFLQQVLGE